MGVIEASDRAWKVVQMTDEGHGAAEWLRGIIDEYGVSGTRSCTAIAEALGIDCRHEKTCRDCIIKMMTAIADRIDAERVERPASEVLDADGVPIKVGDTAYCDGEDEPLRVIHITDSIKVTLINSHASYYTVRPSRLTHERPDSWKRIEEDAKLAPRDYLEKRGMNPEKTERIASMMADLVRRAKALAKKEEA